MTSLPELLRHMIVVPKMSESPRKVTDRKRKAAVNWWCSLSSLVSVTAKDPVWDLKKAVIPITGVSRFTIMMLKFNSVIIDYIGS